MCDPQRLVAQAANDREILLTSLSLGCFSISSLWSSTQFGEAELSMSLLQLIQGDLLTAMSHIPDGKVKPGSSGRGVEKPPAHTPGCAERLGWVLSTSCALLTAEVMRKRNCKTSGAHRQCAPESNPALVRLWKVETFHSGQWSGNSQILRSQPFHNPVSMENIKFSMKRSNTLPTPMAVLGLALQQPHLL